MSDEAAKQLAEAMIVLAAAINNFTSKCSPWGGFEVRHSGFPQQQWNSPYQTGHGGGTAP